MAQTREFALSSLTSFKPSLDVRSSKYMWLGTDLVFEAFKFFVKETEFGTMQIHGYPYSAEGSTFIVEMHPDVWERADSMPVLGRSSHRSERRGLYRENS